MVLSLFFVVCQNSDSIVNSIDFISMGQFVDDDNFKNKYEIFGEAILANIGKCIEFDMFDGKKGSVYVLMMVKFSEEYFFVFYEWWGLNDYIWQEVEWYFDEFDIVNVLVFDLYDGEVVIICEWVGELIKNVKEDCVKVIIQGVFDLVGLNVWIGIIGWCFGGGWFFKVFIQVGDRGEVCVMYYGMFVQDKEVLMLLKVFVLVIFVCQDEWIILEVV